MKVLLDIKDSEAGPIMKRIRKMRGVKAKTIAPTKAQFLAELSQAVKELNLVLKGKKKARPAKELLNEL